MRAILDSGPLIALWNREKKYRGWVRKIFDRFTGPYYVTEPVLTEVAHLTGRDRLIVQALREGKFLLPRCLGDQLELIEGCLEKFPHCDLADASVVALSERYRKLPVISTDRRHFVTYRLRDGRAFPLELPHL